jgi:hypothetical protein
MEHFFILIAQVVHYTNFLQMGIVVHLVKRALIHLLVVVALVLHMVNLLLLCALDVSQHFHTTMETVDIIKTRHL